MILFNIDNLILTSQFTKVFIVVIIIILHCSFVPFLSENMINC